MNLIADTNIWYDISRGLRDPSILKQKGHKLFAQPTSLLEISSKISDHTLKERRAAAKAVLDHADDIMTSTEIHLTKIWNLESEDAPIDWRQGFAAIAGAKNLSELEGGVVDIEALVIRSLNVKVSNIWRSYHWEDFKNKVENGIDVYKPGYKNARRQGKTLHMNKQEGCKFEDMIMNPCSQKDILLSMYERAVMVIGKKLESPTDQQVSEAALSLEPYVKAYSRYLIKCATIFVPDVNDLGDLECFIYLQKQNRLLTSEKRWIGIAKEVCPQFIFE